MCAKHNSYECGYNGYIGGLNAIHTFVLNIYRVFNVQNTAFRNAYRDIQALF